MSTDKTVKVAWGGNMRERATLLIGTALELGYDARVVRTTRSGFVVPADVARVALSGKTERKAPAKRRSRKTTATKAEETPDSGRAEQSATNEKE